MAVARQRLDLVIDRGQLLVLGLDQAQRLFGDVRIGGQHHRHRLADVTDLVQRQDRLVVERRAVIRIGDQPENILAGDDAMHAGHLLRGTDVDRADAAVGDGAAEDFSVQHAGQDQVVGVFGAAGDLGARFKPRNALSDLRHGRATARCGPARGRRSARGCRPRRPSTPSPSR